MNRYETVRWIKDNRRDDSWKRYDIQPPLPVKRKGLLAHLWQAWRGRGK